MQPVIDDMAVTGKRNGDDKLHDQDLGQIPCLFCDPGLKKTPQHLMSPWIK